jgi:uncharacterized protein YoxC
MMELTDWLLIVLIAGGAILGVLIVRLAYRLGNMAESVETTLEEARKLMPHMDRLMDKIEAELLQLQTTTTHANEVVADLQAVTGETRRVVLDIVQAVDALSIPKRTRAAMAGLKAGLDILRSGNSDRT